MDTPLPDLPEPAAMHEALTFTWEDKTGALWRTAPIRQGSAPPPMPLTYVVGIFRDTDQVGVARRKVAATAADGLHVQHIAFHITDDDATGSGFPTAYWTASLARYRALGISRVTFLADDDGRTFWARDPVRLRNPNQPRAMLAGWVAPTSLSSADAEFIVSLNTSPELFTPADLYARPLGRRLLARQSWHAVADL